MWSTRSTSKRGFSESTSAAWHRDTELRPAGAPAAPSLSVHSPSETRERAKIFAGHGLPQLSEQAQRIFEASLLARCESGDLVEELASGKSIPVSKLGSYT